MNATNLETKITKTLDQNVNSSIKKRKNEEVNNILPKKKPKKQKLDSGGLINDNSQEKSNIAAINNNKEEIEDQKSSKKRKKKPALQDTDQETNVYAEPRTRKKKSKSDENTNDISNAETPESQQARISSIEAKKSKKNATNMMEFDDADDYVDNNKVGMSREVNIIDIKTEPNNGDNENVVHISIKDAGVNSDENYLLNQLENKMSPKTQKDFIDWPQDDVLELISRMEKCLPQYDKVTFVKRLETLQWDTLAFKSYTAEQCKNTWFKIQKRVRKYRILAEVLKDAKQWTEENKKQMLQARVKKAKRKNKKNDKHPDMPRKPLSAYFIYYMEHQDTYQKEHPGTDAAVMSKVLAQQFTSLPPHLKKKYDEISAKNMIEYKRKLEEFYEAHPEVPRPTPKAKVDKTKSPKSQKPVKEKVLPKPKEKIPARPHPPFHYYYLSELEKENVEDKAKFREICKEKWKTLPERNKLVWIHFAEAENAKYEDQIEEYVKKHPGYVKNHKKQTLSRQDLRIKDRASGKPQKPPSSAYNIFARKLLQSEEIKKVPQKDRLTYVSDQWKICPEEEKRRFKEEYIQQKLKYKEEYNIYLESLTEEERQQELAKIPKRDIAGNKVSVRKEPEKKSIKKEPGVISTETLKEPEQPPISPYKYFLTVYKGQEPPLQAWKALNKEEKKFYKGELDKKKRQYMQEFEKFLKSLTEEELAAFSLSRKKIKEEQENNETSNDEDSASEEDSEEDSSSDEDNNN